LLTACYLHTCKDHPLKVSALPICTPRKLTQVDYSVNHVNSSQSVYSKRFSRLSQSFVRQVSRSIRLTTDSGAYLSHARKKDGIVATKYTEAQQAMECGEMYGVQFGGSYNIPLINKQQFYRALCD